MDDDVENLRGRLADADSTPTPGEVVFAPDGFRMGLGPEGRIRFSLDPPEHSVRPSVSHLFCTISESCPGRSIAVLLTGMGRDGALELKSLRDGGATTFTQDEESSVVHGMPGEEVRIGTAYYVLNPTAIGDSIVASLQSRRS